jgi:hypothetical protein
MTVTAYKKEVALITKTLESIGYEIHSKYADNGMGIVIFVKDEYHIRVEIEAGGE